MKKLVLLCLAPAMLLAACNKGSGMKTFKGAAEDNNYGVAVGSLRFNISSQLTAEDSVIFFAIENEGTKDLHFVFSDSYLIAEGDEAAYMLEFEDSSMLRMAKPKPNEIDVPADSSVEMVAFCDALNRTILQGKTVTFHTVLNNKYSFTISNFCEDLR